MESVIEIDSIAHLIICFLIKSIWASKNGLINELYRDLSINICFGLSKRFDFNRSISLLR